MSDVGPDVSPLDFLPVMLAAWRVLCDASRPIGLSTILMRISPELFWLARQMPTRAALEDAVEALAALGLVKRSGLFYARVPRLTPVSDQANEGQEESLSFKNQEEEDINDSSSSSRIFPKPAQADAPETQDDAVFAQAKAALKAAGIVPHVRRELLHVFPNLTAEDVTGMERYLKDKFPSQYSPGLLVFRLRQGERAPAQASAGQKDWFEGFRDVLACPVCGELPCECIDDDRLGFDTSEPAEESA
jgi:hypothetical protein